MMIVMAVTVDHQPLLTHQLGLRTVGQVLAHLQKDNRLVVHVLIDGREPDPVGFGSVRREAIDGHELFIETADPRQLAIDALSEVGQQLREADRLRLEASNLLQRNSPFKAMEKLSGCFSTWQNAQESVLKTAQLLRLDLAALPVGETTLTGLLAEFTTQLRDIKRALEHRDFVALNDILRYEATRTSEQWREALDSLRARVNA
jgi:hypothetical protein